jgi:WD40 repeat protein
VVCVCEECNRKEVASLAGQTDTVCLVAFSPEGQHIVSGSYDRLVKMWSVSARKEVVSLVGHASVVCSVAFSPDGQHKLFREVGTTW